MVTELEYALMAGRAYQSTREKKRDRLLFWRFAGASAGAEGRVQASHGGELGEPLG